jgi:hypothetical protein
MQEKQRSMLEAGDGGVAYCAVSNCGISFSFGMAEHSMVPAECNRLQSSQEGCFFRQKSMQWQSLLNPTT